MFAKMTEVAAAAAAKEEEEGDANATPDPTLITLFLGMDGTALNPYFLRPS